MAVEAAAMASGSGAGPRLVGISEMLGVDGGEYFRLRVDNHETGQAIAQV